WRPALHGVAQEDESAARLNLGRPSPPELRRAAVSSPLVRSRHRVKRLAGTGWHCGGRRFDPGMLHQPEPATATRTRTRGARRARGEGGVNRVANEGRKCKTAH